MPKPRKSSLMEKCRICLCENGVMSDIFTAELRGLMKELIQSTTINVIDENDNYPRNICHICLYKLDMWCNFKAQFIRSNEILLHQLKMELWDHDASPTKRKLSKSPLSPEFNEDGVNDPKKIKKESSSTLIKTEKNAMNYGISSNPSENFLDPIRTPPGMLDSASETHSQRIPTPALKVRSSIGRRTSEQRLASTQRWEARKKALLAATGENDSDTDSMASDENQLSPIQKARAKNNAEKEAERQRRLGKASNNLIQTGILESTALSDLQKSSENNVLMNLVEKNDDFIPQSVQSEIVIGDATYVVTSTLLLTEPFIDQDHQTREKISEDLPNYQNTDIMDAVKLKRVKPLSIAFPNDKKLIERCLNIEVEGTELPTLQKVQTQLAKFVENEVKQKLMNNSPVEEKTESKPLDSGHTLEQKLKTIIEKTLKRSIENSRMKRVPISKITMGDRINKTFSPSFIKAAMKSPHFQPKVVLSRVELPKVENLLEFANGGEGNHSKNIELSPDSSPFLVTSSRKTYPVKSSRTPNILKSSRTESATSEKPDDSSKKSEDLILNADKHVCRLCGSIFSSKSQVEAHLEHHKASATIEVRHKMMRCRRCQEIVDAKFVKTHVCKTNKYKCEICNRVFNIQSALERHLKEHEIQEEQTKIERQLMEHTEDESFVVPVFSIPTSKSVSAAGALNDGDRDRAVYSCFICDKNFLDDEQLREHLQTHCDNVSEGEKVQEDKKIYQCAICGESLQTESGLEEHVEKHLCGDEDDNPNLINIERVLQVQVDKQLHTCVQCAQQFDTEFSLVMHMQQHEEEAAFAEWGKQGLKAHDNHACTICEETFNSEETLANHLDLHNGSCHICELCDRPFWTIDELQQHVISHCT